MIKSAQKFTHENASKCTHNNITGNLITKNCTLHIIIFITFSQYNCTGSGVPGGGGEYIIQSGFGWTNGVALDLINSYYATQSTPNPPSVTTSSSSSSPYLWFISIIPLSLLITVTLLCLCWCQYLYRTGKTRYWARVRHEQLLHSSSEPQSPIVYSNPDAIDDDNSNVINNVYRHSDV